MNVAQVRKHYPHQLVADMVAGREIRKSERRQNLAVSAIRERRKAERRETVQ